MQYKKSILREIVSFFMQLATMIVVPILLVIVGAVIIGISAVYQLEWLFTAGLVVATIGVIPIARAFFD